MARAVVVRASGDCQSAVCGPSAHLGIAAGCSRLAGVDGGKRFEGKCLFYCATEGQTEPARKNVECADFHCQRLGRGFVDEGRKRQSDSGPCSVDGATQCRVAVVAEKPRSVGVVGQRDVER